MSWNGNVRLCVAGIALAAAVATAAPVSENVMLMNRIGPSKEELFIADADGSNERYLLGEKDRSFDYNASVSADGQWVVFTSERDAAGTGQADLYRVHPDGSGLERLTSDSAMEDQGALSPDSRTLAFASTKGRDHTTHIWVMDLATRKQKNLTDVPELQVPSGRMHSFFRPSWSPDGQWLAFSSDRGMYFTGVEPGAGIGHTQGLSLYIMRADGTGVRRLTNRAEFADGAPHWSQDGKRIAFYELDTFQTMAARFMQAPTSQIISMDVATGARNILTTGSGLKVSPQYIGATRVGYLVKKSPKDGPPEGIAYAGEPADGPVRGPTGTVRNPSWTADGKRAVYQRYDITNRAQNTQLYSWNGKQQFRYTDVFPALNKTRTRLAITDLNFPVGNPDASVSVMDPDGSNRQRIFHDTHAPAMTPSWSPDGQWLAVSVGGFFFARDFVPARIVMVKADGSETRELTSGLPNAGFPSWSPDGKSIVYRVWQGTDVRGLRLMNLADRSVNVLTTEWGSFPFWSPSGDRILFTRQKKQDQDFDIFSMKPDGTDIRQLTFSAGSDSHATWTADGRQIWFYSSRSGFKDEASLYDTSPQPYAQVFLMNRDGSNVRQVTDSRWEDSMVVELP